MMFPRSATTVGSLLRHGSSRRSLPTKLRSLASSSFEAATPQPQQQRQPQFSSQTEQWQHEGILDERGLVNFDTLHNMQVRSCRVFAHKNLFATFSEESQKFEWMTFAECTFLVACVCVCALLYHLLSVVLVAHIITTVTTNCVNCAVLLPACSLLV